MLPFPFGFLCGEVVAPPEWDFLDDFNRADSTLLGNDWTASNAFDILNNELVCDEVGGNPAIAQRPVAEQMTDGWVEVTLMNSSFVGDQMLGASVIMRKNGSNNECYQLRTAPGGGVLILARRTTDDISTTIDSDSTVSLQQGDVIRLECIGTSIKGYLNGVEKVSGTSSHIAGPGRQGVRSDNPISTDTRFDDFKYKSLD